VERRDGRRAAAGPAIVAAALVVAKVGTLIRTSSTDNLGQ
jgi:hypothetical protein